MWPTTRLRFDNSRSLVRNCQEDAEIGKFRSLILPTDRNYPSGENSCDTNICHLQFEKNKNSPVTKPWYTAWWIVFVTYIGPITLQFTPSGCWNSKCNPLSIWVKWSHQFTSLRSGCPLQGTMITLICVPGSWHVHLHHQFPNTMSVVPWSLWPQLTGLVCRCGSIVEQSRWPRSIDIISGLNSIQAASNNKYADKDKDKPFESEVVCPALLWYPLLKYFLLGINGQSTCTNALLLIYWIYIPQWPSIYVVSRKYIPSYAIFYDRVEQFHDATWVGVNGDWMLQLLYEWQKFMNNTYPFLLSDPWCSYIRTM